MKKTGMICLIVLVGLVMLSGITGAKKDLHFTFVTPLFGHPYWVTVQDGMNAAAEEFGVECEWVGPMAIDIAQQIQDIETAIASNSDAIITMALNPVAFAPVINQAEEAGIPVVLVDTDAPYSKRSAYAGTDNKSAGFAAGEAMVEVLDGQGKVGIITGAIDANNLNLRIDGFEEAIKDTDIKVVAIEPSNTDLLQATEKAQSILQSYPDIDAFFGVSASDVIGAAKVVKEMNKVGDVKLVGFDDMPETIDYIKNGVVNAAIVQRPYMMGYLGVKLARDIIEGKDVPEITDTGIITVTKENVDTYKDN